MEAPAVSSKVLIVDDEDPVAETLAVIFRMHGYEVQTAKTAEDAVEVVEAWHPDLALIDVMLPGMNGIELAIVLKHHHAWCQTLLFSGSADTAMLLDEAARRGHVFEILPKPIPPQQILELVRVLLAAAVGSRTLQRAN